jgi:very-short-patch-repair endonuclease
VERASVVQKEWLQEDPWWFVEHRRGIRRPLVGEDPLEARAVSKEAVAGYLQERIFYKALVMRRLSPGIDFTFQTSRQGGRMELGGIVVDFLFPIKRLAVNIEGPTHKQYLRSRKDEEQTQALKEMGYEQIFIPLPTVESAYLLENWLRQFIDRDVRVGGGLQYGAVANFEDEYVLQTFANQIDQIGAIIRSY